MAFPQGTIPRPNMLEALEILSEGLIDDLGVGRAVEVCRSADRLNPNYMITIGKPIPDLAARPTSRAPMSDLLVDFWCTLGGLSFDSNNENTYSYTLVLRRRCASPGGWTGRTYARCLHEIAQLAGADPGEFIDALDVTLHASFSLGRDDPIILTPPHDGQRFKVGDALVTGIGDGRDPFPIILTVLLSLGERGGWLLRGPARAGLIPSSQRQVTRVGKSRVSMCMLLSFPGGMLARVRMHWLFRCLACVWRRV